MPSDPAPCMFAEPEARLPGLEKDTICPGREMNSLGWLFQLADYMPSQLPAAGGLLDQPALLMDAIEAARLGAYQWQTRGQHGADH
ncbi:hypothetical protein [Mariprofundus ferrooxydans]|uniref:hypothetical protein n=1 Tax=Mariprofundus ferrooxydans TaxID=314344 RepID=UPI00142F6CE8|nr:hypothetical protein [Mariprofundus ferrooxydans]